MLISIEFFAPRLPPTLCFPGAISEESPLKFLYCVLYLLATVLVTGLGFYLYFTRVIKTLQKQLTATPPARVKEAIIIENGHPTNQSDTMVITGNKEYL
jgi:hypothetical protein